MVKTGGSIFIALPLVVMLLSLLPVYILFVRKVAITAILNVLRAVCLFVFLQYLTLYFIQPGVPAMQTAFRLAQFTLVFYLFKLMMSGSQAKDLMNMMLVSFLSVVITIFSLKGITAYSGILIIIEASVLTVLAFVVLLQLISNKQTAMPNEPGFWIAGGMLCFFGMVVFMEAIAGSQLELSQQIQQEKGFIVTVADILRMVFFIVAASIAGKNRKNNNDHEEPSMPPLPPLPSRPPFKIKY
ncbi:hypothetical protein [Niastella populi]|nr:hypothetical protein [Niastella populi]